MFERLPPHMRLFVYFFVGSFLILSIGVLLNAGAPLEWTPTINPIDDNLIPIDDPSPPHFTPGTLSQRPADSVTAVPIAEPYSLRWRAGVGVPDGALNYFEWTANRPGWYLNWTTNYRVEPVFLGIGRRARMEMPAREFGMEFTPMVRIRNGRLHPDSQILRDLAQQNRGLTWLIGNEPDVRWQDNTPPEIYAIAYYRAYHAIKSGDPTAKVAIGGISQVTPLRLQYLDRIWDFYHSLYDVEIPVDVWNMHAFVLREERSGWGVNIPPGFNIEHRGELWEVADHDDLALVEQQIWDMREWMAARGQRDKPLWITEYGILMPVEYGFDAERVAAFLEGSFALFLRLSDPDLGFAEDDNRLVQRWNWYSARDSRYPTGNLFDNYGRSTPIGDAYWNFLARE